MNFSADTPSGDEGRTLFAQIRARHPDLPVILLTAWTHLDAAVDLVKSGAADYLSKPWNDDKLVATVRNLIELGQANQVLARQAQRERRQRRELEQRFDLRGMVWQDPATERVLSLACQVARADVPVLITGPNGAGKERIAEIIQANSLVAAGPFVVLNCGALPSELIEAELFGAEAGAYTGAARPREGKFEAADGGTLFLDEIGNLPRAGQMKLLRVLETGRFERLGSNRERQVKVRVISATNADLPAMIRAGTFREDLFYRLNVIELRLPPLVQRPGDILPLANHFLGGGKRLSQAAEAALLAHGWPGNVRELRNVMTRACLLAQGDVIDAADLVLPRAAAVPLPPAEAEPEAADIVAALARANGVVAQAAAELGLSRQALYRRMDRLGIARP
jgi:DNA-binding NtrC family response regulator